MTWDALAFEGLRQARGGPQLVPLIAGQPDVLIDVSGIADLMVRGRIGNPLLQAVLASQQQMATERETGTAPEPGSDAFWDRHRQTLEWQDALLAAIVLDPPWCPMPDLPADGTRPPGRLCIYDLTPEERRMGADLVFTGVDGLETFRAERRGPVAGPDGRDVPPPAEHMVSVDPLAPASGVLVRSRRVAAQSDARPARARLQSGERHAS